MKKILQIPRPIGVKHIFWEHAMKSVFAFSGMFALLFFGPIFLESKVSHHSRNEDDLPVQFLFYLIEHPEVQFLLCFLGVLVMNFYLIFKNSRKKFIVEMEANNTHVLFGKTSLYYRKIVEVKIDIAHLEYLIHTKKSDSNEKTQTLQFIDKSTGDLVGIIKPSHHLWSDELVQIRSSLAILENLGVTKRNAESETSSAGGMIFRR